MAETGIFDRFMKTFYKEIDILRVEKKVDLKKIKR